MRRRGGEQKILLQNISTLSCQELIVGVGEDVVGLDHRHSMTGGDGGVVGRLSRISWGRRKDTMYKECALSGRQDQRICKWTGYREGRIDKAV